MTLVKDVLHKGLWENSGMPLHDIWKDVDNSVASVVIRSNLISLDLSKKILNPLVIVKLGIDQKLKEYDFC